MAADCKYAQQLLEVCRLVSAELGRERGDLVYQSRSGPPNQPWLEPDVGDALREMNPGAQVVIVPIGFISDHMEVLYDLDTEARAICDERGIHMVRAATVGVHPAFLRMIRELILERIGQAEARAIGRYGPSQNECRADCCPAPARRPSSARSDAAPQAIAHPGA
jgi:ferrochelatase